MSQETWIAVMGIVYTIITVFNNVKQSKKVFNTENVLKELVNTSQSNIDNRDDKQDLKINFILNDIKNDYEARLDITNDPEEQQKLIAKINTINELRE